MNSDDPWLVSFWVLAAFSMLSMLYVVIHVSFYGELKELRMQLIFNLYLTVLIEQIAYLPGTYNENHGLCRFMGWLHYYSGMVNVLIVFLMSCIYFSFICAEKFQKLIMQSMSKYGNLFIFTFPFITLLPFTTNSYDESREIWCTLPGDNVVADNWSFIIFYSWVILFLFIANIQFFYSIYRLSKLDLDLRQKLFQSSGAYILISTYSWIPRILMRIFDFQTDGSTNIANLITTGQLYFSGFLYLAVYLYTQPYKKGRFNDSTTARGMELSSSVNIEFLKDVLIETPFQSMNRKYSISDSMNVNRISDVERISESTGL